MIPLKTPISYYGGKQRMISKILPMIPIHKIYVEPYFGGGAVFFSKPPSYLEVINDTNGNVVNFYQVMQSNFKQLETEIANSLFSEELHIYALRIYRAKKGYSKVKRAWAFWYVINFSYANKIGGGWKFDNGTHGSHIGVTFHRKKFEFHEYANRLQKTQIHKHDGIKVMIDRDTTDTFQFIDPPYVDSDQGHYKGFKQRDLDEILEILPTLKSKWMLCHFANNSMIKACNKNGWYVNKFGMRSSVHKDSNRRKTEIIITNYQSIPSLFENEEPLKCDKNGKEISTCNQNI